MGNKKNLLFLPILLMVALSGCVSLFPGSSSGHGNGIVIEEFIAEPGELQSGEPFDIRLLIRNAGSAKAFNVHPELYNIDTSVGFSKDTSIKCTPSWELDFDLLGRDDENGMEGESKTYVWRCLSPPLEKGLSVTYNPSVRVYYAYSVNTIKSVTIASQDELKNIQSQGGSLPSDVVGSADGPVNVEIKVKGPVKSWEGKGYLTFPVELVVHNTGGGTVCSLGAGLENCADPENWNRIVLYTGPIDISFRDCDLETGRAEINLWEGKEGRITCEAVFFVPGAIRGIVQKNIDIRADYIYFTDQTTSVFVEGTKEF